jgi:hypothetical protein
MKQLNPIKQMMRTKLSKLRVLFMSLARATVASGLLVMMPVQAQPTQGAEDQMSHWRQANDAVGKFRRGHIDILKSESKSRKSTASSDTSNQGVILTLPLAKRLMLEARPSLFTSGAESAAERNAHAVLVNESMSALSRAWVQAVGAKKLLKLQEGATEAAEIANELGQRMGKVGNWGADRVLAVGLQASAERLKLSQAQENAVQTKAALAKLVMADAFALPEEFPAVRGIGARQDLNTNPTELAQQRLKRLPDYASDLAVLSELEAVAGPGPLKAWEAFTQSRVSALLEGQGPSALTVDTSKVLWNHDMRAVLRKRESMAAGQQEASSTMAVAQAAVKARHAETMLLANEFVPLAVQAEEEAVYQYNGMFISTWQLLEQFRSRTAVEMALTESQMRYWDAEYAFEAYLAGAPYHSPAGGGASVGATGAAGGGH